MNEVVATVVAVDPMDAGARTGVSLLTQAGRTLYLYVDNGRSAILDATMKGALAHGDALRIGFETEDMRLGAPQGRIVSASVIGYQVEIGYAA